MGCSTDKPVLQDVRGRMSDAAGGSSMLKRRNIFETQELDMRLLGMLGAFVLICLVLRFEVLSIEVDRIQRLVV